MIWSKLNLFTIYSRKIALDHSSLLKSDKPHPKSTFLNLKNFKAGTLFEVNDDV